MAPASRPGIGVGRRVRGRTGERVEVRRRASASTRRDSCPATMWWATRARPASRADTDPHRGARRSRPSRGPTSGAGRRDPGGGGGRVSSSARCTDPRTPAHTLPSPESREEVGGWECRRATLGAVTGGKVYPFDSESRASRPGWSGPSVVVGGCPGHPWPSLGARPVEGIPHGSSQASDGGRAQVET